MGAVTSRTSATFVTSSDSKKGTKNFGTKFVPKQPSPMAVTKRSSGVKKSYQNNNNNKTKTKTSFASSKVFKLSNSAILSSGCAVISSRKVTNKSKVASRVASRSDHESSECYSDCSRTSSLSDCTLCQQSEAKGDDDIKNNLRQQY